MRLLLSGIIFIILITYAFPSGSYALENPGHILGKIVDSQSGEALAWATVEPADGSGHIRANDLGEFSLANLVPGLYSLQVSRVGYETQLIENIQVQSGKTHSILIKLLRKPTTLKSMVVTPGSYSIMGTETTTHQTFSREEIATVPQLGDDLFRSVLRLPGMSGNDFSTRFDVRGGEYEEVLVTLDGLEIHEPFHMKDFDGGAISVIDAAAVDGIELMTGGFAAKHGGKMSGAFNIRSQNIPAGKARLSGGMSLMNLRALAEGSFADGRGSWLVSARRGFMDIVLKLVNADPGIKPRYYDLFGKVSYQLSSNHLLSLDMLHAHDDLDYFSTDDDVIPDTLISSYGNTHIWSKLNSILHPRLTVQTIASAGRLNHNRRGRDLYGGSTDPRHIVSEEESSKYIGLKTDWQYEVTDQFLLELGLEGRSVWADYDYDARRYVYALAWYENRWNLYLNRIDTISTTLNPHGQKFGGYISGRFHIGIPLTAEVGWRYDYASYSGDDIGSPRVGIVYEINPRTSLRAAWGKYFQIEDIHEISVIDGEKEFCQAQRADHHVIGLEHNFLDGTNLRIEVYHKKYSRLRPEYRNSQSTLEMFPELEEDRQTVYRAGSTARGIEFFLKRDIGSRLSWYASYAYAKVDDSVTTIYSWLNGQDVPYYQRLTSPRDIRNTVYLDLIFRPGAAWQLNLAFQYHTGWPYTPLRLLRVETTPGEFANFIVFGEEWKARFESFHRLDVRLNKFISVGQGRLNIFTEVLNVYGRKNARTLGYRAITDDNGTVLKVEPDDYWFGIMPSIGVSYEVEF